MRWLLVAVVACAHPRPIEVSVAPLLVVADLPRSLAFYEGIVGAHRVVVTDGYAKLALGGSQLHLATRSDPTVDKPGVRLAPPDPTSSDVHGEVVVSVRDCRATYERMVARGATFLSPPTVPPWGHEVRAFVRDPDGHLIEISQDRSDHLVANAGLKRP